MIERFARLCITPLMILIFVPVMAQDAVDLSQSFIFDDGTTISYPEDWEMEFDDTDGSIFVFYETEDDYIDINVLAPSILTDVYGVDMTADWQSTIEETFFPVYGVEETEETAFGIENGIYFYDIDEYSFFMAYELEEGSYIMMFVIVDTLDDALIDTLGQVLISPLGEDAAVPPGRACMISVETANTVQIRVGPSETRPVVDYFPAHVEILPMGRYVTDDDQIWFRLNEDELELEKVVDAAWVPQTAVMSSGNCVDIPFIIPFPVVPLLDDAALAVLEDGSVTEELNLVIEEIITFAETVGDESYCATLDTLSAEKLAVITPLLGAMSTEQAERFGGAVPEPC